MPDIIMFSTDDYNHHQKKVLIKPSNPCHNEKAKQWFTEEVSKNNTEVYHGAIILDDEAAYDLFLNMRELGFVVNWM